MRAEGFYWLVTDYFSKRGVGQWFRGEWYLINEKGAVSDAELTRRGWTAGDYIGDERDGNGEDHL